jgi:hypothetical protein
MNELNEEENRYEEVFFVGLALIHSTELLCQVSSIPAH